MQVCGTLIEGSYTYKWAADLFNPPGTSLYATKFQLNFNVLVRFYIKSSHTGGKTTCISRTQGTATSLVVHLGHITAEEYTKMKTSAVPLHF
jgi:hypothetical protein